MDMKTPLEILNLSPRSICATARRDAATAIAAGRPDLMPTSNLEDERFSRAQPTSFTKGLHHNDFGLVDRSEYRAFRKALTDPAPDMGNLENAAVDKAGIGRTWDNPLSGHCFALEGPDPADVAVPPAPRLGRSELTAEIASVYAMALLRDVPFTALADRQTVVPGLSFPAKHSRCDDVVVVGDIVDALRKLAWFDPQKCPDGSFGTLTEHEKRRRQSHWDGINGLTVNTLFRGSTAGARSGPYISQFMLLGTGNHQTGRTPQDGIIGYGAQVINQRVTQATPDLDFMTNWDDWLEVQNGAATQGRETYRHKSRRVTTPRDLATYVHFDQLYQAYLNACLIMLGNQEFRVDVAIPSSVCRDKTSRRSVTCAGPHVPSLLAEVASRGLRAARRQEYQVHRRGRPEVLAARLTQVANGQTGEMEVDAVSSLHVMLCELGADNPHDDTRPGLLLHWITQHNAAKGKASPTAGPSAVRIAPDRNYLLPMAFSEGAPMHPSYGAGHATVAGACVTILKAFFASDRLFLGAIDGVDTLYQADPDSDGLLPWPGLATPSIADELDKLAANISIARNMAGVNFYSDYYDSLRMGERIAAGILEEQMMTYSVPVRLSFQSFDGDTIVVSTDGTDHIGAVKFFVNGQAHASARDAWLTRDLVEYGIESGLVV